MLAIAFLLVNLSFKYNQSSKFTKKNGIKKYEKIFIFNFFLKI